MRFIGYVAAIYGEYGENTCNQWNQEVMQFAVDETLASG